MPPTMCAGYGSSDRTRRPRRPAAEPRSGHGPPADARAGPWLRVGGVQLQRSLQLANGSGHIVPAIQRDRQVEVIIRLRRISCDRLLKQRRRVLILAAQRNPLVIHHLGQRQTARHEGKRRIASA